MKLKRTGKIYLLFFVLTVVLTFFQLASAAQALPTLTVGNAVGTAGEQVVVPIQVNGVTSMDSFNIVVLYDPQVLQPDAGAGYVNRVGTLTANYELFMVNANVAGEIQIGGVTLTPTVGSGVLMRLLFTINPGATESSIVSLRVIDDPGNDLSNSNIIPGSVSIRPEVVGTTPGDSEINLPLNTQIIAIFSKDMNPMTINRGTFTIKDQRNAEIPGMITYSNRMATYTFSRALNPDTTYTGTLNSRISDTEGNKLGANYVWQFTTEPPDLTPPEVILETPGNNTNNVPLSTEITAIFNKDMNPTTINRGTFTIKNQQNRIIPGVITYDDMVATYRPLVMLSPGTTYTATLTTGVADLNRQKLLTNYGWEFTTEPLDLTPPEVIAITPEDNQTNVPLNAQITATFNKDMNPITINRGTFTIKNQRNLEVPGTLTYYNKTATYKPYRQLNGNTTYTATLTTRITDLSRQTLPVKYVWRFTTL